MKNMMHETIILTFASIAGAILGVIFFGGLWWTIRRGLSSRQPALWFFVSLPLRTAIVLAGFLFISRGHFRQLVACLLGFTVARFAVMRLTRPSPEAVHAN
jgi:F1F0 ATPase subunit 2